MRILLFHYLSNFRGRNAVQRERSFPCISLCARGRYRRSVVLLKVRLRRNVVRNKKKMRREEIAVIKRFVLCSPQRRRKKKKKKKKNKGVGASPSPSLLTPRRTKQHVPKICFSKLDFKIDEVYSVSVFCPRGSDDRREKLIPGCGISG
ncbi:hypothetical protein CEXT_281601 [Caerostris extrusa]|uniref:Ribosomal protein S12 n=1 Tax=Caerostris extrusa TaxID=172846 RepID=A0AAV4WPS0_CAEEX|nr:hypothetical protein CEXT_281601 [Caerostris extrusa]